MRTSVWVQDARSCAAADAAALDAGRQIAPKPPRFKVALHVGEHIIGDVANTGLSSLTYARHLAIPVSYHRPGSVVMGNAPFVAGYMLCDALARRRYRKRAERESAPRWITDDLGAVLITNQRLLCLSRNEWLSFDFLDILGVAVSGDTVTVTLASTPPVLLAGAWAPWIGVVVAYTALGPARARRIPGIRQLLAEARHLTGARGRWSN